MKRLIPFIVISLVLSLIVIGSCSKKEIVYELTSDVLPVEGGTISPSQGTFDEGELVTISAISSKGYYFINWGGNISGTDNPYTFTIDSDTKVVAIFAEDDEDGDGVADTLDDCPNTPSGEHVNVEGCADSQKDSDNDGVTNDLDECPETEGGLTVDDNGCADNQKDADNDGVKDDVDLCLGTPIGEIVDANGCSNSQNDTDGDGVTDDIDQCANTPEGETVDAQGCSDSQKDSDSDGVTDNLDRCQNTPSGETVDSLGCSATQTDADGDTITDESDQCPNTPTGESVDADGCSDSQKDTDGDGVLDNLDQCPGTPSGESVDVLGCSDSQKDSDVDGVNDDIDQCANTPSGETVNAQGCSTSQTDSDGDGIADHEDACPNTPSGESVDAIGCSSSQTDQDGDGITDDLDQCQNTPTGESIDVNGCSDSQKDSDGDGVSDNLDLCPGTPTGVNVDETGCELVNKTYVPDDLFEQILINLGYDDILDNYVPTDNIKNITSLVLLHPERYNVLQGDPVTIDDFTGLQDFVALEELEFQYMQGVDNLDLSSNLNLKKLVFACSIVGDINIKNNVSLEELWIYGSFDFVTCHAFLTSDLDLSENINLKTLVLANAIGPGDQLNAILASVPSIEVLNYEFFGINGGPSLDLLSNVNLRTLNISTEFILHSLFINLKNGANYKLEKIQFSSQFPTSNICIQVDDPTYVESIVYASSMAGEDTDGISVTTDCSGVSFSKSNQKSSERILSQSELEEYRMRLEEFRKKVKDFNTFKNKFIN